MRRTTVHRLLAAGLVGVDGGAASETPDEVFARLGGQA